MSAFLGNIHYWLFNKIQVHENILVEVLKFAEEKNEPIKDFINEINSRFGAPVSGALEDEINHGNIHGWLQEKIQSVELRIAATVTNFLNKKILTLQDLETIFYNSGKGTMQQLGSKSLSAADAYKLIFDYMLEGMPCDRVNEEVSNSPTEFSWRTNRCLHKDYWNEVSGDISNFYILRDNWIKGFLEASNTKLTFERLDQGICKIKIGG